MEEKISYKDLQVPFVAKMITTSDNPYNPFDEFDEWFLFDTTNGYNTCGLIARYLPDSRSFDVSEENEEINSIIDRIVKEDPFDQYIIVTKEVIPQFYT